MLASFNTIKLLLRLHTGGEYRDRLGVYGGADTYCSYVEELLCKPEGDSMNIVWRGKAILI